jgi:16S rRNA (cytidine1402-2'-O)-methyltransferase
MVVFLSPHRVGAELADLAAVLGDDREVCVARELTKLHEEICWGTLDEARCRFGDGARGELTIVIAGSTESPPDVGRLIAEVEQRIAAGASLADAVRDVAQASGVSRRRLYEEAIRRRNA